MKDLISVIIPCYNASETLPRALNSVREQDYKNLEIIIVNDGSVDDSLKVATEFAKIDPRITVINQENSGVSVARNNGLLNAHGEYIIFLDADDNYTTPYAYSEMLKKLKEEDADMCVCNFTHPCFEQHLKSGVYDLTDEKQFMTYYQDFFASSMPWNKITKRECLTEKFIQGVHFNEDELFNLANLHNIKKVVVIDKVYHNYYCAPYVPMTNASAINSAFRDSTDSVWHMAMKNYEYRLDIIEKFFPEKKADMQYIRCFDYFFWVFFLMAKNRVTEGILINTYRSIMNEKLFKESLKDKEKYGVHCNAFDVSDIEKFVKLAYYAYRDIKSYNKKMSMYSVFLGIFGKIFCTFDKNVNEIDMLAKVSKDLKYNRTAEALYVNSLFDMMNAYNEQKNDNIILIDNSLTNWLDSAVLVGQPIKA